MPEPSRQLLQAVTDRFTRWLHNYGETSWDHQTFYAGRFGRVAKQIYYKHKLFGMAAVAPIIFCEALVPSARRFFFIKQRFPIADAHYAMAFASRFEVRVTTQTIGGLFTFARSCLTREARLPPGTAGALRSPGRVSTTRSRSAHR